MDDRDHFAAAALAGLLTRREYDACEFATACEYSYRYADAMLRERERRAPKILNSGEYGPEWHAAAPNLDAAPAARARTDADTGRTDKAVTGPGEGTGDTPVPYSRTDEQRGDSPTIMAQEERDELNRLREAIRRLAEQDATLSVCEGSVTVTMDATLTDAEREAVERCVFQQATPQRIAVTLRGLLERLK